MLGFPLGTLGKAVRTAFGLRPSLEYRFDGNSFRNEEGGSLPFTQAATYTGGLGTMVDSDGLVKWAPHNLLTYSEDFSAADWNTKDGITLSGDRITEDTSSGFHYIAQIVTVANAEHTFSVDVSNVTNGIVWLYLKSISLVAFFDVSSGTVGTVSGSLSPTASIESIGGGVYRCTIKAALTAGAGGFGFGLTNGTETTSYVGDGSSAASFANAHLYRSDLGGMVNNPETGDSYVRTAGRPFGPELVSNGTFDTDTAGWSATRSATLSSVSGQLVVTSPGATGGAAATQVLTTVVGQTYVLTVDVVAKSGGRSRVAVSTVSTLAAAGTEIDEIDVPVGVFSASFVATSTATYVHLSQQDPLFTATYDNVSVKEIDVDPSQPRYLPRIGHHVYDGTEWVNEGLLIESEARTNLVNESQDIVTEWFATGGSLSAGIDPGIGLGSFAVFSSDTANQRVYDNVTSVVNGETACGSLYIDAGQSTDGAQMEMTVGTSGGARGRYSFEIDGNEVIFTSNTNSAGYTTAQAYAPKEIAPGVWKVALAVTNDTGSAQDWTIAVWNIVGNANDIAFNGAQLEVGSTPSSYIPTSGATATRAAETLTIDPAYLPDYKTVDGFSLLRSTDWLAGFINDDTKGAFLSSTDTSSLVGGELVTNGTFDSDTSGWTDASVGTGSVSVVSGEAVFTRVDTDNFGSLNQILSVTADNNYVFSIEVTSGTARVLFGTTPGNAAYVNESLSPGIYSFNFFVDRATIALVLYSATNGANAAVDNISVKLADDDRSVNNNPLTVNGTVTRTPVATGADLVGYDNLDGTRYLEQSYNADLDFGTGDFYVMGWVKGAISRSTATMVSRCSTSANGFHVTKDTTSSSGAVSVTVGAVTLTGTTAILDSWYFFTTVRASGVGCVYVNGELENSVAQAADVSGSFVTQVGYSTADPKISRNDGLALLRIGAGAPTADQIKDIYEAEKVLFEDNASLDATRQDQVSIQMDGRVTYADTGSTSGQDGTFFDWESGAEEIRSYLLSGQDLAFVQNDGTTFDFVARNSPNFPEGILVPYSIASRHGSTFINGAADGVALTANTTPTALPDLSNSELDLAPIYMGTIKKFQMWDKDIGDDGLEKFTS